MLEVKLKDDGALVRRKCLVCGGFTDKDSVQARVYEDGEFTFFVVCPACLALSPADRVARLHRHAQHLRALSADMDAQADDLLDVPSHAEWTAATDTFRAALAEDMDSSINF